MYIGLNFMHSMQFFMHILSVKETDRPQTKSAAAGLEYSVDFISISIIITLSNTFSYFVIFKYNCRIAKNREDGFSINADKGSSDFMVSFVKLAFPSGIALCTHYRLTFCTKIAYPDLVSSLVQLGLRFAVLFMILLLKATYFSHI